MKVTLKDGSVKEYGEAKSVYDLSLIHICREPDREESAFYSKPIRHQFLSGTEPPGHIFKSQVSAENPYDESG